MQPGAKFCAVGIVCIAALPTGDSRLRAQFAEFPPVQFIEVQQELQAANEMAVQVAQRGRRPASAANAASSLVLQEDRDLRRKLDGVRKTLEEGNVADGARFLGTLLQDPATRDFFIAPSDDDRARRSFKAELRRLISTLPEEGQRAYELQFGSPARKKLALAISAGDAAALQEVASQYYHTEAAGQALFLLGKMHLDRGRPREAISCLSRLREAPAIAAAFEPQLSLMIASCWMRAGDPEQADQTLLDLKQRHPMATFTTATQGVPVEMFSDASQSREWLAKLLPTAASTLAVQSDWPLHLGNTARQALTPASYPFRAALWTLPISSEAAVLSAIENEREGLRFQKATPIPLITPLAVGNTLLLPARDGVQAIDIRSGQLLWPVDNLRDFTNSGIERQIWRDAAFGSLTTDGRSVFFVADNEELPDQSFAGGNTQVIFWRGPWGGEGGSANTATRNRLVSLDIAGQGKLRWSVGGEGEAPPELAEVTFLGNPVPYGEQLFVLAEQRSAIRLYCLDTASGSVEWWQELAVVENTLSQDFFRRMVGATPSISDGVVVCPTSAGGVVAVDLATRSLLWAYQYPRTANSVNAPNRGRMPNLRQGERWLDGCAILASGRAILTPPESDEIHCLDLFSGQELWTQKRGQSLYVAGVFRDKILLIDAHEAVALNLATGQPAFKLPLSAAPSGRGILTKDGIYHLPQSNAKIAQIDVTQGNIAGEITPLRGIAAGNLIWHNGLFISVGPQYIEAFDDALRLQQRVASDSSQDPRSAELLFDRGRLALADGELANAVTYFRQAYAAKKIGRYRSALVSALQDAVNAQLSEREQFQAELDKLLGF